MQSFSSQTKNTSQNGRAFWGYKVNSISLATSQVKLNGTGKVTGNLMGKIEWHRESHWQHHGQSWMSQGKSLAISWAKLNGTGKVTGIVTGEVEWHGENSTPVLHGKVRDFQTEWPAAAHACYVCWWGGLHREHCPANSVWTAWGTWNCYVVLLQSFHRIQTQKVLNRF